MPDATPAAPAAPTAVTSAQPAAKPVDATKNADVKADAKPAEAKTVAPAADKPVENAVEHAKRWFGVNMQGIPNAVNVLAYDADEALSRFKRGHGIRLTPYPIQVWAQGDAFVPSAADIDHHHAIEAAYAAEAQPKD